MYIHGLNITALTVQDASGQFRYLGCPDSFLEAYKQMQTLQQAGASFAGYSFIFWRDDKRRKNIFPEIQQCKGTISKVLQDLLFGAALEKQQFQRNERKVA